MKSRAFFFKIGEFSLINDAIFGGLKNQFPELHWKIVDVEWDIVRLAPLLHGRAILESMLRYGPRILSNRQPPRDFFSRIPTVIHAVRQWVQEKIAPSDTAMIFQTQSLFDARHPSISHFLYTDHTYLANRRYARSQPQLFVPEVWLDMERQLYAKSNCNFVSSGFAAASLREDYQISDSQIEIVFSGANVKSDWSFSPIERTGRVILFVGVDWERKGGPELLHAFRKVRKTITNAELWIVGCSPKIDETGVRIFGRLKGERVADCYRAADIFCLPSRMDPSASVLAEAALYKLPIVATPVGGNAERIKHGINGFLCEPEVFAESLIQLLQSSAMRDSFGSAGYKMAEENFTWEAVCGKMANRIRKELDS